jgi:Protein of unknown function DUF262
MSSQRRQVRSVDEPSLRRLPLDPLPPGALCFSKQTFDIVAQQGWEAVKNFDSRVYSVTDFREWYVADQLELSPKFQRRSVWTDTARSYLMDTIVRGKPIPKVFLRQRIDSRTGSSIREVVDGQQRLRTILTFLSDGFVISKRHYSGNVGGKYFSQMDEDTRLQILGYEIATDLLVNVSDEEVLDIFGRLNSHAVVLNEQEKLNASHFGPFKKLADDLGHKHHKLWISSGVVSERDVLRMADVALAADLLISLIVGIRSKKQLKTFYSQFERDFEYEPDEIAERFEATLSAISEIYGATADGSSGLKRSEFHRIHLYYSLFTAVYHCLFSLPGMPQALKESRNWNVEQVRLRLDRIDSIFEAGDSSELPPRARRFLEDSRRATTDAVVRQRRTQYVIDLMSGVDVDE